nr:ribonuclease H-like domain-containing protein [Tanacetum cinerariifolium]
MSTQQDIYAAGSENSSPMLKKFDYVPWSSRLIRYANSELNVLEKHLEEIHVTWVHLKKKRTRLRTNTKTLEDFSSESLETASPVLHDTVTTHIVTASQSFITASPRTDSHTDLEDSTHDNGIPLDILKIFRWIQTQGIPLERVKVISMELKLKLFR